MSIQNYERRARIEKGPLKKTLAHSLDLSKDFHDHFSMASVERNMERQQLIRESKYSRK